MLPLTFLGNEDLLEIIPEKQIKIPLLNDQEFACSFTSIMHYQEWTRYFTMLDKPIYTNLVKEFWKHAYLDYENGSITPMSLKFPLPSLPF